MADEAIAATTRVPLSPRPYRPNVPADAQCIPVDRQSLLIDRESISGGRNTMPPDGQST